MASSSNVKEISMFARTSLGTRIVVPVSPDTTVRDFKRIFERAHLNCFEELGRIKVYGIKMKKKSCFYNLHASFPLKHVSENSKNHLLHIEVYHHHHHHHQSAPAEICNRVFDPKDIHNKGGRRRKRNTVAEKRHNCGKEGDDDRPHKQCSSEINSESISVSSIINRYFTNYDEVTSSSRFFDMALPSVNPRNIANNNYHERTYDMSFPLTIGTPLQILQPESLDQQMTKSSSRKSIGRCLVAAADNIGVNLSKKSPTLSLFEYRNKNPLVRASSTPMKDLVFNINDEGD